MIERLAVRFANWILRTFAPRTAQFTTGVIEYGMRAAAQDELLERTPPPDWRKS
jgi:hypothetical protein